MIDGGLGNLFQKHLPTFHWQRVETGGVGLGVPDINGCCNGVEFWIENKKANGFVVNLRPEQVAWAERRIRKGGRVYVAIRRQNAARGVSVDELWLFHGSAARDLLTRAVLLQPGSRRIALGQWSGGPARWDWNAVAKALLA